MPDQHETQSLLHRLEQVAQVRIKLAYHLNKIADILVPAEIAAETGSGPLGLKPEINDLQQASQALSQGKFRLLVLGDMKRGKSTLLNALMGENLLPSDVNPCTAVLTVLQYGTEKRVTVYFNDGTPNEHLDFATFKAKYSIHPDEAKHLESQQKQAFPHVEYALVEYPLPLLEKGISIVDSPGLNDTEARNQLSLNYINRCQAILFVLRASQPCTLEERRYLDNYIKGRGLSVFFLINGWDEISKGLINPEDPEALEQAETNLRQVFHQNLGEYCQIDGYDLYSERVFEVSALNALRRRLKNAQDDLEGTGFPPFIKALNTFLTQERAIVELRQARTLARQVYQRIYESIQRRIPLLNEDVESLKSRLQSIEPEFIRLTEIRDQFQTEIQQMADLKSQVLAESFEDYILNLGNTFEVDFVRYQPTLGFLEFLQKDRREEFQSGFKQAFQRYLIDQITTWERAAELELAEAFTTLKKGAESYGATYYQVTNLINEKLIGRTVGAGTLSNDEEDSPGWAKWAMGFFSLASGNVAGVVLAAAGFDWKNILVNWLAVFGISSFLVILGGFSAFFGPLGIAVLGLGVGAFQADQARKEFLKTTKKEFVKYLPQLAQSQQGTLYQTVHRCFDEYETEVIKRINDDISSRQTELDTLLQQKQSREINREQELQRLQTLEQQVGEEVHQIEAQYLEYLNMNTP